MALCNFIPYVNLSPDPGLIKHTIQYISYFFYSTRVYSAGVAAMLEHAII